MEFLVTTQDFIILGIGIITGWMLNDLVKKVKPKILVKIVIVTVLLGVWVFNNVIGDGGTWYLNLMVGVLVAQFFELKGLQERLIGLIGSNNEGKNN